jgi:hypothetical protein
LKNIPEGAFKTRMNIAADAMIKTKITMRAMLGSFQTLILNKFSR